MPEITALSRVVLLDLKRDGLSDAAVAGLYDTEPRAIEILRTQYGVPALAMDLRIREPRTRLPRGEGVRRKRGTGPDAPPIGRESMGCVPEWENGIRTSDEAEAYFDKFFKRRPNFSYDDVKVKPMRRLSASTYTSVGIGASSLDTLI
jgi:hypothetical protein